MRFSFKLSNYFYRISRLPIFKTSMPVIFVNKIEDGSISTEREYGLAEIQLEGKM